MAGNLDLPDIRGVPLWRDIVVLQDAGCVEEVHKWLGWFACGRCRVGDGIPSDRVAEILLRVEVLIHAVHFVSQIRVLAVGVSILEKALPHLLAKSA